MRAPKKHWCLGKNPMFKIIPSGRIFDPESKFEDNSTSIEIEE